MRRKITYKEDLAKISALKEPENEVFVGNGFDVHGFIKRWEHKLLSMDKDITVAVMGCVVNGPGEGKHADIGITGAGNSVLIFKKGKVVRTLQNDDLNILSKNADIAFSEEIKSL